MIEKSGTGIKEMQINSASYPVTLSVTGGDVKVKDNVTGQLINRILKKGETLSITNKSIDKLTIEEIEIPTEFKLLQNYPNPFKSDNKDRILAAGFREVTLEIYDILGREVENTC